MMSKRPLAVRRIATFLMIVPMLVCAADKFGHYGWFEPHDRYVTLVFYGLGAMTFLWIAPSTREMRRFYAEKNRKARKEFHDMGLE